MTLSDALRKTRKDVRLVALGDQYIILSWSDRHNACWQSDQRDFPSAQAYLKERRIANALRLLDVEDHDAIANSLAQRPGYWEKIVREEIRK